MRSFLVGAIAAALATAAAGPAQADDAAAPASASERRAAVIAAIRDGAEYSKTILLDDAGRGRADYDMVRSVWKDYEVHWHTGQTLFGLLYAHAVTGEASYLARAVDAGDWWISTEFQEPHVFAGLVDANHGDHLGRLINMTTVTDGTNAIFALSRVTGDPRYADTATRSGDWFLENAYIEAEGLFYNLADPTTGEVLKDRSPHFQHAELGPDEIALRHVARPNSEGYIYADMYRHTGQVRYKEVFLAVADKKIERQDPASGLWMDFEPNDYQTGKVHPRFNIWNAEAQLEAYALTGEQKYLDSAVAVARFMADNQRSDGTIYYDLNVERPARRGSLTGSAVAFSGILWLRLRDYGVSAFDANIERSVNWLLANRYPTSHPDPNIAGATINTRTRHRNGEVQFIQRDIGTSFALRFLAMYVMDMDGADVNDALL